eukprot:scaffold43685_cov130-Amphora_coffeaeformis.AAC.2
MDMFRLLAPSRPRPDVVPIDDDDDENNCDTSRALMEASQLCSRDEEEEDVSACMRNRKPTMKTPVFVRIGKNGLATTMKS